ncbi:MAG: YitT family protein [Clostridia bacterium]|nr:YitT family protein [Clostridia bacterium]
MKKLSKILHARPVQYLCIIVLAVATALSFVIFVYPNDFAPAGINGFATIVQHVFGFSIGYMSLLINIPMLAVAMFVLDRSYSIRTLVFTLVFSGATLLFQDSGLVDVSMIVYDASDVGGAILAAIAGGFFGGLFYSLSIRLGGSTGGTDIVAAFIHHKYPEYDTVGIIFVINAAVAVLSFFVYGFEYQPVILCIVFCFVSSRVSDWIFKGIRSAVRFEVVTPHAEALSRELMEKLHHGVTMIPGKGMYTGKDYAVLICIVNRRQVVEFENIIRQYDNTFASISTANGIVGQFSHGK